MSAPRSLGDMSALWHQLQWDWKAAIVVAVAPFALTYLITLWNASPLARSLTKASKRPPTAPYVIPYLGHALEFGSNGGQFLLKNKAKFGASTPFELVLPGLSQFVTTTPQNTAKVFRSQGMVMTESHVHAMEFSFGLSPKAAAFYRADDSGYGPTPKSDSTVRPDQRIIYELHNLINRNLTGDSLAEITARFQAALAQELEDLDAELQAATNDGWVDIPDLRAFMEEHVFRAAVHAMFGPQLLALNPTLVDDFWAWSANMGALYMRPPRFLARAAYASREKMLESIMRWHSRAHEGYDVNRVADEDEAWEPFFGSRFSRRRQALFGRFEVMDARSKAADDLSFMWASNANSVYGALWFLLELLRDPSLNARMQAEFAASVVPAPAGRRVPTYDVAKLTAGPLCQSVYAETLRLHVGVLISRRAYRDVDFAGWRIRKGERVSVASYVEAMDAEVWNAGSDAEPHPLGEFWAERFLVYPDDPSSGPLRRPAQQQQPADKKAAGGQEEGKGGGPRYSMEGVTNSWIPYSGGPRHCPGRHFAKTEMIVVAAMMTAAFEVELRTEPGWKPKGDASYFGFGSIPPVGKIPCRIRRRKALA